METIIWLKELTPQDLFKVGKKAIEISNFMNMNIQMPQGFVVNGLAFRSFLEKNNIHNIIPHRIKELDPENKIVLEEAASSIRNLILESNFDPNAKEDILEAYDNLNINLDFLKEVNKAALNIIRAGKEHPFVVLRANFAGDFSNGSFNVFCIKGNNNLIEAIKKCWASLFTANSISKMIRNNVDIDNILISIIIQKQVQSTKSGIIYTKDNDFLLEAGLGLVEPIITKDITPDLYQIEKKDLKVVDKQINNQKSYNVLDVNLGKIMQRSLSEDQRTSQKLSDYELLKLGEISRKIEQFYNEPRDIEFAVEGANILIMQTKPSNSFRKPIIEEVEKTESTEPKREDFKDFGDISFNL